MKIFLIFILTLCHTAYSSNEDWYKTASFYQIYPQAFYDGGGGSREGFGTFSGIKQQLDYIKSLGIDCIWLTPIFESSFNAFGYDITNYEEIDSRYGTKKDFKELIDAIHEKGMKVIVDFVPNHCGYEHPFFQKSMANDPEYANWFVWANGKGPGDASPPSNWQRIGGPPYSAWNRYVNETEVKRPGFFYAQFYWNMPDFNFREPEVRKYWEKFLKLWLDFGLDGFRIDAISHGYEFINADGEYPNEPIKDDITDPYSFDYLDHVYTQDQPELFELMYSWREILDLYNDTTRIMMTESWSSPDKIMKFYQNADGTKQGVHLPFNFQLIQKIKKDSKADDFVNAINAWFSLLPKGKVTNWVIGNHDQSRVASRFGTERIDIFNMLVSMLPGTSMTYYGEEIGMEDSCVFYDFDHNKPGHTCTEDNQPESDARFRTPMQWDDSKNGGFTKSSNPWLPIGEKYKTVNVAAQNGVVGSHLEIYKALQQMRSHKALKEGSLENFKIVKLAEYSFGFKREITNVKEESVLVIINYGNNDFTAKLDQLELFGNPKSISLKIVGFNSKFKVNQHIIITKNEVNLGPYESIVATYNRSISLRLVNGLLIITIACRFFL